MNKIINYIFKIKNEIKNINLPNNKEILSIMISIFLIILIMSIILLILDNLFFFLIDYIINFKLKILY